MRELALRVGSGALVALELPADLKLEPSRVFAVEQIVHVHHSHGQRQGSVGRGRGEGNARDTHHLCGRVQIITRASGRRHYGRYRLAVFKVNGAARGVKLSGRSDSGETGGQARGRAEAGS